MSATTIPTIAAMALLDVRAIASLLGRSTRHVYRLANTGRMPAPVKLGALVRWPRGVVEDWISAGCPSSKDLGASRSMT